MSTPAIIKIVRCLKNSPVEKTEEDIATIIGEPPEYVKKALEKLMAMDVVTTSAKGYVYHDNPDSNRLSNQLEKVYEKVGQRPARQLLIRAYICQVPSEHLFHLNTLLEALEREGLDRAEVVRFLGQEIGDGYLKRIGVIYKALSQSPLFPICVTPFHFERLRRLGAIVAKEYTGLEPRHPGPDGEEEEYLVINYPRELASAAMEYAVKQKRDLREVLKRMAIMGWSGWLWGLKKRR